MTAVDPRPGDWVLIRAKVINLPIPEDVTVELFSETDQQWVQVRRDQIAEILPKPIPDEPGERSVALVDGVAYQRVRGEAWQTAHVLRGYTWAELHELGDVEVIHHG